MMETSEEFDAEVGVDARDIAEAIALFLRARFERKLEPAEKAWRKQGLDEAAIAKAKQELAEPFAPAVWIADAAKRAGQLEYGTHIAKGVHPKTESVPSPTAAPYADDRSVGTGVISELDVSGNAAALDVRGFLSCRSGGRTVLDRLREDDPELRRYLEGAKLDYTNVRQGLMQAVAKERPPAAHTLLRQVYARASNDEYHLLVPLYPSGWAHVIRTAVRETRFGEKAKLRRTERRDGLAGPNHVEYKDTLVQMFGSGKPQNISYLTWAGRGEAHLLASLPPIWRQRASVPVEVETVFRGAFTRAVRGEVRALRRFLLDTGYNNVAIREERARLVEAIVDGITAQARSVQPLEPGWSARPECVLEPDQRLWLDAHREDEDFQTLRCEGSWRLAVAESFARWLNYELQRAIGSEAGLPVGDAEFKAWRDAFEDELEWEAIDGNPE